MWRRAVALGIVILLVLAVAVAAGAQTGGGYLTPNPAYLTLDPAVPAGSSLTPIVSVGESAGEDPGDFVFEGIPDGIGLAPGEDGTVQAFVAHEQTTVPFFGEADFQDASVSKLILNTADGSVADASVALGPEEGYIRFCSAFMAGPDQGFDDYTFLVGEESDDVIDVPPGAQYGPDPAIAPQRQAGYTVALDVESGEYTEVAGMGRLNHENSVVIPGDWIQKPIWTTDDTFDATTSQLYMYLARGQEDLFRDKGSLWAFQVTRVDGRPVDPRDPFNGANDYLDIQPGDDWQGRFIRVPKKIARGETDQAPQAALEEWSNDNNVFQFIRLEDLATDDNDPRTVYVADTGASRVVPDPDTGRMHRPPGVQGFADNGRIFKFVVDEHNPRKVTSFSVFADGDAPGDPTFVPMTSPDNVDTSANSLMVQEDTDSAKIWRYDFAVDEWTVVAIVNDPDGESSGIVDASEWFGDGSWLVTVQAHGANVDELERDDGVLLKREDGQLLLMELPGS